MRLDLLSAKVAIYSASIRCAKLMLFILSRLADRSIDDKIEHIKCVHENKTKLNKKSYDGEIMSTARKAAKDPVLLGMELRDRREYLGYSMRGLASEIGTSHHMLGRVERGLTVFDYYTATRHTYVLGLDDRDVMFD